MLDQALARGLRKRLVREAMATELAAVAPASTPRKQYARKIEVIAKSFGDQLLGHRPIGKGKHREDYFFLLAPEENASTWLFAILKITARKGIDGDPVPYLVIRAHTIERIFQRLGRAEPQAFREEIGQSLIHWLAEGHFLENPCELYLKTQHGALVIVPVDTVLFEAVTWVECQGAAGPRFREWCQSAEVGSIAPKARFV